MGLIRAYDGATTPLYPCFRWWSGWRKGFGSIVMKTFHIMSRLIDPLQLLSTRVSSTTTFFNSLYLLAFLPRLPLLMLRS